MPDPAVYTPMSVTEARRLRDALEKQGKKLVFTNGCFDLLHAGHVRYLQQSRALGDALIIGLNSDASVRELKGPTRPLNREHDRAEVLAGLRAVDGVVIFSDKRATGLIEAIQPHIYAKGGDYTPESLDPGERAALGKARTQIQILSLVPGRSTTKIIERMSATEDAPQPLRLGVLGSGKGSNLRALTQAIQEKRLDAEIVAAISDQSDSEFLKTARAEGLPVHHVHAGNNPRRFEDEAQRKVLKLLQEAGAEVVVLTGFMRILKEPVLSAYADRIVNVHPSLLPAYKGANAVQNVLDEGEIETGCTVHLVNAEIDAGKILAQAKVPILIGDTPQLLHARIKEQEHILLPKVLAEWKRA
jgi:formyltetrahydrofolate-dependent phosphoribosylglycinamide formyltransferase